MNTNTHTNIYMFLILVLHLFMCFHSLTPSHLVLSNFSTKSKFDTNLVDTYVLLSIMAWQCTRPYDNNE